MNIDRVHDYRFNYLKSDEWKLVKSEALANSNGQCEICGETSIFNDAHHIWYPKPVWDTKAYHLVILCRACHEFVHVMLPHCKTNDEKEGLAQWHKIKGAIMQWRRDKIALFRTKEKPKSSNVQTTYHPTAELRRAYLALKEKLKFYELIHGKVQQDYDDWCI